MDKLADLVASLAPQYPLVTFVFTLIGFLRVLNKPVFSILRAYVLITPTKTDNEVLDRVLKSKAYATFVYLLDWVGSVKIKP